MFLVFETVRILYLKVSRRIKYPYHFRFENEEFYSEQRDWISENIKEKYIMWKEYREYFKFDDGYTVGFSNKEDAMAFKLTWS